MEHNIVDTLKCEAIKQTLDFFNSKYHLVLITGELEAILNEANDDIYNCIDLYNKMVFEGRTDELKQLIFKYRDGCFKVISNIKVNEMYVKNSGANNLVDDFCTCVFYDLVYESQLNELLQENRHQPTTQHIPPNDYDKIFTSIEVWNVFYDLVKVLVDPNPNSKYANFSVIFQTFIDKKIIPKQRHKIYLNYCDTNHNTDFSAKTKLKSNTSNHSTELVTRYLNAANLLKQ